MTKNGNYIEVPRYIVKAIVDYRMPDYEDDDDWEIGKKIENDFDSIFNKNNQLVSGKPFKYQFDSQKDVSLLTSRIKEILHLKFNRPLSLALREFQIALTGKTLISKSRDNSEYISERKKAEAIVNLTVDEVSNLFRDHIKELPRDWKPKITMDWSPRRIRCWGGYNPHKDTGIYGMYGGISMAMGAFLNRDAKNVRREFLEYSHISKDPIMGGFSTELWALQLLAVTSHECAHAAQYYYFHQIKCDNKYKTPHGFGFQYFYRLARQHVVNPRIMRAGIKIGIENKNENLFFEDT